MSNSPQDAVDVEMGDGRCVTVVIPWRWEEWWKKKGYRGATLEELEAIRHHLCWDCEGCWTDEMEGDYSRRVAELKDTEKQEIAAKLAQLIGADLSNAAERGMERVIKRRDKRKQDKRKSDADAKRKSAAISTMKKLVPQIGQVKASEEVERRMNKRHYESNGAIQKVLPVSPGTVKRWYNAELAKENKARNEAAKRRLDRPPT